MMELQVFIETNKDICNNGFNKKSYDDFINFPENLLFLDLYLKKSLKVLTVFENKEALVIQRKRDKKAFLKSMPPYHGSADPTTTAVNKLKLAMTKILSNLEEVDKYNKFLTSTQHN